MRLLFSAFSLGTAFLMLLGSTSHAAELSQQDAFYRNYFKVGSVETKVIGTETDSAAPITALPFESYDYLGSIETYNSHPSLSPLESGSSGLEIADIVLKVWDIIERNKAVANVEMAGTSALPKVAAQNWQTMTGWKPERSIRFSLVIKNLYGMKVVELEYDVKLLYGGGVRGKGLYIASARVLPTKVSVLWAYNLDVKVNVASVYNVGTEANPVAAVALDVQYKYGSLLSSDGGANSYLLRGDGLVKDQVSGKVYFPGTTGIASSH